MNESKLWTGLRTPLVGKREGYTREAALLNELFVSLQLSSQRNGSSIVLNSILSLHSNRHTWQSYHSLLKRSLDLMYTLLLLISLEGREESVRCHGLDFESLRLYTKIDKAMTIRPISKTIWNGILNLQIGVVRNQQFTICCSHIFVERSRGKTTGLSSGNCEQWANLRTVVEEHYDRFL